MELQTLHNMMFINGDWTEARDGTRFDSCNPATEEVWTSFPEASSADVDVAVKAAYAAFTDGPWSRMSPTERGKCLHRIAREIEKRIDMLALTETRDTGKLLRETRWQARNLVGVYDYYGGLADKVEGTVPPTGPSGPLSIVVREPLGVVAAIVPWNSQLHLAGFKIAPALAAGNTIVVKASEHASAALVAFAEVIAAADLPKGVVNIITGGAECGAALVGHPLVRRISFTGGVDTARHIIPQTAANIASMSLELGGKSPVVVYDDADIDTALLGVVTAAYAASGQSCAAGTRLLLQSGIYDRLLPRLVERVARIRVGEPESDDTHMGPLATLGQRDRIERHLADTIAAGGELLLGGRRPAAFNKGWYFEPTIVACPHQDFSIVRNELFGPVLSVLRFDNEAEAIALAKDSRFAFAGGVFTQDAAKAFRTAQAIPAGRFWINTYRLTSIMVPYGGRGDSGYGREGGLQAIHDYSQTKGIFLDISGSAPRDPFVMRS